MPRAAMLLAALFCCYSCQFVAGAEEQSFYTDQSTDTTYYLADLIFPSRPTYAMSRMYPHIVPFWDMLDPVKRSYRFGFPESLRGSMSLDVPTQIVFYVTPTTPAPPTLIIPQPVLVGPMVLWTWLKQQNVLNLQSDPVKVLFTELMNSSYNISRELFDKLGSEMRDDANPDDLITKYLYRDYVRGFLIGTWESWLEDGIFHDAERIYTPRSNDCPTLTDVLCFWRRFQLLFQSTKLYNIGKSKSLSLPTRDPQQFLVDVAAVSFWFSYCTSLVKQNTSTGTAMHYCPNPCKNNPCVDMAYTLTDSCSIHNGGLFDVDFKCTCTEAAFWSFSKRECVKYDRCKMNSPCTLTGTESCQLNSITNEVRCNCKAGFMGHDCSQPQDACFVPQVTKFGTKATGNRACNVETGSECIPMLGSNLFSCLCRNGWFHDKEWGGDVQTNTIDPNCQSRHDPCMSLVCETGDCVSNNRAAMCQCPSTHHGPNCHQRRGLWSLWGPWSSCDPDCGDRRVRHRMRTCLGLECLGHQIESAWCVGYVDCGVPERLGNYPTDRWRTSITLRHMLTVLAIGVGVSMGVLFACQCLLSVVLKCDRGLLNCVVQEQAHTDQIMAFRRLSYKTALQLN